MDNGVHDANRLSELQSLPLERKIQISQARIIEWYQHYNGNVYISFSGGKDSTVLMDLARRIYKDIPAVFVNTGLEYPEVRNFALSFDNVKEIRPVWGKSGKKYGKDSNSIFAFKDVIDIYGYPLISKNTAECISGARRVYGGSRWERLNGMYQRDDGKQSMFDAHKYLDMYGLPFKISEKCCGVMKKTPMKTYAHESNMNPIIATMASESRLRRKSWIAFGCNAFDAEEPVSKPMSFWKEQDVLHYIKRFNTGMASVYGELVNSSADSDSVNENDMSCELECTGCRRTGCVYCAFGMHLEKGETRFQTLQKTHPKQYEYSVGGGQWKDNPEYDPLKPKEMWNPKEIWTPSSKGLGMGKVFDMVNDLYGKNFYRYE